MTDSTEAIDFTKAQDGEIELSAPGLLEQSFFLFPEAISACGGVWNGIPIRVLGNLAGGVVDFDALERIYLAAKAFRDSHQSALKDMKERWGMK